MSSESHDVVVVGAGPGGSTAAHLLARNGFDVLVLEKETFPRFKIGESLLPFSIPIFERLGVADELKARFQHKFGALFTEEGKEGNRKVVFADGLEKGYPMAFQVKRAEFDELLADAAVRAGAQFRFGWRVTGFIKNLNRVEGVFTLDPSGEAREIRARVVIDASGRSALGARLGGNVVTEKSLRRGALFSHFANVPRPEAETPGDIRMVAYDKGWWWFIPFSDGTWSVGVVASEMPAGKSLEERMEKLIASVPTVAQRMKEAQRIAPVVAEADYSYAVKEITGDGYVAVGDAAGFLDPIFSSGVFMAMSTAQRVADDLSKILKKKRPVRSADLKNYERFARRGFGRFRQYVLGFYYPGFRDLFYEKPPVNALYSAVTSVLAGGVFAPSLKLRFWTRLFLVFARRAIKKEKAMATLIPE